MVVGRCTSCLPLRPLPLLTIGSVSKNRIRRNLFGSAPPGELLKIAAQILDQNAADFASRWDFDSINEKSLTGDILWTPIKPKIKPISPGICTSTLNVSRDKQVITDNEKKYVQPSTENTTFIDINKFESCSSLENKQTSKSSIKKSLNVRLKQTKITEYGKLKKKLVLQPKSVKKM